ncbi:MAG: glycosyl transferase [Spirochaetaceae bacterium]|nr:MAG: glycosyl transferase [Spirochaetaceae bacterium]
MKPAILAAYFARRDDARRALRVLKRKGYRSAAVIHRGENGRIESRVPALGGVGIRRLIADHSRWLASDESVLILQAPITSLRRPGALLREFGEIPPAIFVLNPKRAGPVESSEHLATPLPVAEITQRAKLLATTHEVDRDTVPNTALRDRLRVAWKWVGHVCSDLSEAASLGQRMTAIVEWILDNQYIIEGSIRDVQQNLSGRFYRELPALQSEPHRGFPRIYGLASQIISNTALRLDRETIVASIDAYQSVTPLSIAELWALPQMLRIALLEGVLALADGGLTELRDRETADFWANRLIAAGRRDSAQLFAIMAELTESYPSPSPCFAFQLVDHLYGEEAATKLVLSWVERFYGQSIAELSNREQDRLAKGQIAAGNAFTSLRELARLDWRDVFEEISHVERLLRLDPAAIYPRMDYATRDRYRRAVEQIARRSGRSEEQAAQSVVDLAADAAREQVDDQRLAHVGTYLVAEGRRELDRVTGAGKSRRDRLREWATDHHTAVYLAGVLVLTAIFVALIAILGLRGRPPGFRILFCVISIVPISQLSVEVMNYLVMRLMPPRALAKMDFEHSGIPDVFLTLVVVPMMLVDKRTIDEQMQKLEIRYLANREDNLLFSLFTDCIDSDQPHLETDDELLHVAMSGLDTLNQRYGGQRFLLLHRQRVWSTSEQKYIGWERKRGKLEELNRLIDGTRPEDADPLVYLGDAGRLRLVRYVITLDSDTQLPAGTARRMIETLAHPLNQPRFDADGRIAAGSYTIIQPRVSPSLPSTTGSLFSRLFTSPIGMDPYTSIISDVNQDLTGEGSYHGKGIYDVRAFSTVLSGRFPEQLLLSHDLIEGAHVRVGLASDIELLDEFPQDYLTFAKRQHRWIRGDWQIADWILPWVPGPSGKRVPNRISWFNRWKILDNLRRSAIPGASMALLVAAWFLAPATALTAGLIVAVRLLFGAMASPLTMATTRGGLKSLSFRGLGHDLLRTVAEASLIPHQSLLTLDAVCRVWYRRIISQRNLLEWTGRCPTCRTWLTHLPRLLVSMALIGIAAAAAGYAAIRWSPQHVVFIAPWLGLWVLSPVTGRLLNRRPDPQPNFAGLAADDLHYLRGIARRTWRFYSQFVSDETSWLPPDNYQVSHQDQLAMRTSPTNIGLWLLSVPAACDFGYLTTDQAIDVMGKSMATIAEMERFKGHLLNWYDIETLLPLEPRYVSTVDSGNLLASLLSVEYALEALTAAPLLDKNAFEGLLDTTEALKETVKRERTLGHALGASLANLARGCRSEAVALPAKLELLRQTERLSELVAGGLADEPSPSGNAAYWKGQIRNQVSAWTAVRNRYLLWMEILAEKSPAELASLGKETVAAIDRDFQRAPSLRELSEGDVGCIRLLEAARAIPTVADSPLSPWIDRVIQSFNTSRWLAGEQLAAAHKLIDTVGELAQSIDMGFLYDPKRKLFPIGFSVTDQRPDNAFYDLLASEARLGSFVAIARGEVPVEHWFTMGRPYNSIGRRRVLLSWTGTMFEYLMPRLLLRSFKSSLLDKAESETVGIQIAYGQKRRVPWGISESAFADLDINKTYQYKAFGVPQLGLKRGLDEELVVAPYASLLALEIAPKQVVANLRQLGSIGLWNEYGFYDAIDYTRQASRDGARGVIVRTYMSHHHGMAFLSLSNYLHGGAVRNHFHSDPRVRAFESLLHESIPKLSARYLATRGRTPAIEGIGEITPSVSSFDSPHTATPKTQLLGNGRYSLMVTNSGGGYSRWTDFELTRWRADTTRDSGGFHCYIHEADGNRLWSNSYHPTDTRVESYSADFSLDRAVIRRVDNGIEVKTEIVVSPEDDVEVRRITLINRSLRSRHLKLTSYIELAMAPHRADLQHPAFNKLFIETEALPERRELIASRRMRRPDDKPVFVGHRITSDSAMDDRTGEFRFETDRAAFIGRGCTLQNPAGATAEPGGSHGYVLDPILSLRRSLTLAPGERRQISLILAAGESKQTLLNQMEKYGDPRAVDRSMDLAWASAQIELRALRIHPDEARRFQQVASHLLFPNARLRPASQRIMENRKGQTGLWAYGISGDSPIILVTVADSRDTGLVRQMLRAQAYWRIHGFVTDLVILNEEASGYEHPLRSQLEALVRTHATGAFLLSADQLPHEDLSLLMAAARVVLVAARGALPQQLGLLAEDPTPPKLTGRKRAVADSSAPLPFLELHYFNGLGGFTDEGREYAIYLGPHTNTPAPWVNVMANPGFGTLIGETGAGFTWYGNSQRNRLTDWSNDPVIDPSPEVLYIRDEESGLYWTPTASPIREESAYRARHGAGYSVFEHNSHAIEQELTVFVPLDDDGGKPVKLQRLRLKNSSARTRMLSVTHYIEWTLGENRESSQMHVATSWDADADAMLARNYFHPEYGDRVAFASMTPVAASHSADRTMFVGRNRSLTQPAAMRRTTLSSRVGAGLDPCSALQTTVEIAAGAEAEIIVVVGQADSVEEMRKLLDWYRNSAGFEASLDRTRAWWDHLLGTIEVQTPEFSANFLINRWLLYQSLSCRMWGRSATYQSGGAFGFRDQLQDSMAFVHTRSEIAREQILLAASRQFAEGDVQHWWHPPSGAGIRSRISDDLLWLPYVVAHYVRATGDRGILETRVPFLNGPPLEHDQHEYFATPKVGTRSQTVFEHCRRAVERGLTEGPNGLPLIGTGDWNDGMDLVGAEGRGESVWLAWFLIDVLNRMGELSHLKGEAELGQTFASQSATLRARIEETAWDGEWYLRAFFDDGTPLGSSANAEAQIDSLPQSWARLSAAGDEDRTTIALDSAWKRLVLQDDGLVLLFAPPFDTSQPSPGYIKGYPPGVRENGGQYTHAALWFTMALAQSGKGDKAARLLRMINPIERTGNPEAVWRYGVEPYVIAADVYRLPGRVGRGGWSWYTGSAAWMYRAWVEEVLGLHIRGEQMTISPVIPDWWDGFSIRYRHAEAVYEIQVENPDKIERGVKWLELDGQRLADGSITLQRGDELHSVVVHMGVC